MLGNASGEAWEASGEASGEVPGEVSGDAFGETLGDGSRTLWPCKNAVFLLCIVASAESRRRTQQCAGGDLPGPNKSTKTQREGNCIRTRITCPRHGGGFGIWFLVDCFLAYRA